MRACNAYRGTDLEVVDKLLRDRTLLTHSWTSKEDKKYIECTHTMHQELEARQGGLQ